MNQAGPRVGWLARQRGLSSTLRPSAARENGSPVVIIFSKRRARPLSPCHLPLLVLDCWFGSGSPTARPFVGRSVDPPSRGRLPARDAALPAVPDLFFGASLPPRRRPSVGPTNTHQPTNDMARVAGAKGAARARALSHTRSAHRTAQTAPQQQQRRAQDWLGAELMERRGQTGVRPRQGSGRL